MSDSPCGLDDATTEGDTGLGLGNAPNGELGTDATNSGNSDATGRDWDATGPDAVRNNATCGDA